MTITTNLVDSSSLGSNSNCLLPYQKTGAIGFLALLAAMLANSDAVQNYISNGLMKVSEAIATTTEAYSNSWILKMNDPEGDKAQTNYNDLSDMGKLNFDSGKKADNAKNYPLIPNHAPNKTKVTIDSQAFSQDNTMYNQSTTFFGGISSGLNDTLSHLNDQVSQNYQLAQSPLTIEATLVSIL